MAKKSTIGDVASLANVSKSTVSNYLNGRFSSMSSETKEQIQSAIQQLSYIPSLSARRLSAKEKCKTICVIFPHNVARVLDTTYFPTVLSAVGDIAERLDYSVLIYSTNSENVTKDVEYLTGMASTLVDGFLIFDLRLDDFYFKEFENAKIPYVCIGKIPGYDDYNYVASDHRRALYDCLEHLYGLGHTKIALMMESDTGVVEVARKECYSDFFAEHNLPDRESYRAHVDLYSAHSRKTSYDVFAKLLLQEDPPTALIVAAGFIHNLLRVTEEHDIRIPEDLSVVALEYTDLDQLSFLNFTRVSSIAAHVTELAFKKLLKMIYNKKSVFESQLEPLSLVIGETTAPPKEGR